MNREDKQTMQDLIARLLSGSGGDSLVPPQIPDSGTGPEHEDDDRVKEFMQWLMNQCYHCALEAQTADKESAMMLWRRTHSVIGELLDNFDSPWAEYQASLGRNSDIVLLSQLNAMRIAIIDLMKLDRIKRSKPSEILPSFGGNCEPTGSRVGDLFTFSGRCGHTFELHERSIRDVILGRSYPCDCPPEEVRKLRAHVSWLADSLKPEFGGATLSPEDVQATESQLADARKALTILEQQYASHHPLAGHKFGEWTVESLHTRTPHTMLLCQCSCGERKPVRIDSLKSGRSTSCGHKT